MANDLRKTGIEVVGDMPWGAHFCLFYETKDDLLDILISYCKAGLESGEYCLWVVADPVTNEEAMNALKTAVPEFDRYLADCSIEIITAHTWYLRDNEFDLSRVTAAWHEKLAQALAKGYAGVRVTGDTAWLRKKDWRDFCEYEEGLNEAVANQHLCVLCTYPLSACGAVEILDVVRTHQFALAKRHGSWDIIETAGLKQAKAEIKRLNEDLEQRVLERTSQLMRASEALREMQTELAHVNRIATMGQLTASISHEVKQPIAAARNNASVALRLLRRSPPDLEEVREALNCVVNDTHRASAVIDRIRDQIKRAPAQNESLDLNDAIIEVIALTRVEVANGRLEVQTRLAEGLPPILGDRVQLQQVVLNLMLNAMEAISLGVDGPRTLLIGTEQSQTDWVLVAIRDSGPGIGPEDLERVFDSFYTTKPGGVGLGLSISRSIIEAHGGRLWAEANLPQGAAFQFILPAASKELMTRRANYEDRGQSAGHAIA